MAMTEIPQETERISKVEYRTKVGINMHIKALRNIKKSTKVKI
jgi:hypothetical protein